jgi:hypothetical protein
MAGNDSQIINQLPMKTSLLSTSILAATLFLATGSAAAAGENKPADQSRAQVREGILKQYDADGDGKLNPAERSAAREAMQKLRKGPGPGERPGFRPQAKGGPRDPAFQRGYLMGKFDANGDGKLDETERAAAKAAMEQRMRAGAERQLERLKTVDTDGDGKISDAEWAAAREKMQAWRQERGPKAGKRQD